MLFSNNLKYLRKRDEISQLELAKKLGISDKTISSWEIGRTEPNMEELSRLSNIFHVNVHDFLNTNLSTSTKAKILAKFKLYQDPVSAGLGSWLSEGTEYNYVEIEHPPMDADFALKIRGDSMAPLYNDDEVVFVKANVLVEPGQIGVFLLNGEGYLKQWQGNRLLSLNNEYEPIQITEYDTFMIIGKVVMKKQ